jgi:hypothetical protein
MMISYNMLQKTLCVEIVYNSRMSTTKTIGGVLGAALGIALNGYLLSYLARLEQIDCECAMDWRRKHMMYGFTILISFQILNLAFLLFNFDDKFMLPRLMMSGLSLILTGYLVITTLQYVFMLKREACICSEDTARIILEVIAYVQIAGIVLIVGSLMFALYMLTTLVKRAKSTKKR